MLIANHMAEVDDRDVADLLGAVEIAMRRELAALREIDLALQRIGRGTYGICADCDRTIEPVRLSALPTVRRCLRCRTAFEKRRGIVRNPVI